ncbi:hypothetical protein F4678DRAFT_374570 [Xylaria arbuscula]|nr:hypothetical protein F4678DRAFT_374570 [Xylaria arbuscula]
MPPIFKVSAQKHHSLNLADSRVICPSGSFPSHHYTLNPRIIPRWPDAPAAALANTHNHAHEVMIVASGRGARGTQAHDLELGRRLPGHAVPERAAVVEPVAWPARLSDGKPMMSAVAADVVSREAHCYFFLFFFVFSFPLCLFLLTSLPLLPCDVRPRLSYILDLLRIPRGDRRAYRVIVRSQLSLATVNFVWC